MAVHSSPIPRSHSPAFPNLPSPTSATSPTSPNAPINSSTLFASSNSSSNRLTVDVLLSILNEKSRFVPFAVDHENFEQSCRELLEMAFPEWFRTEDDQEIGNAKHLKLTQCTEGITNKLMKCKNLATGQVVLIRAYGKKSEIIIDRQAELITFAALQEDDLAPKLYCRFENGFIYGFIPGIPLKPSQLSCPKFFPLIAKKMAKWHQVDNVPGDRSSRLFRTLWKWLRNIPKSSTLLQTEINIEYLETEIKALEIHTQSLNCPIVFCHNDLLAANIIYNPEIEDVAFIDYEYGSFNYRSFDIANHFCEFAGFDCDYSCYPSEPLQRQWIKEYLTHSGEDSSEESVSQVYQEVEIFTLVAHFFWCLWAIVQAHVSDIPFDYMAYAVMRFKEFKLRRSLVNHY